MSPVAIPSFSPIPNLLKVNRSYILDQPSILAHQAPMANSKRPTEVIPPVRSAFAFDSMEDALAAFARGEFLVVMDDENRENEGDLIIAASFCSTEKMAWMIKHTRCACFYSVTLLRIKMFVQWIHLHCPSRRTFGRVRDTNDVPSKSRTTPNGLCGHSGSQKR
jgi:hypothetical protein